MTWIICQDGPILTDFKFSTPIVSTPADVYHVEIVMKSIETKTPIEFSKYKLASLFIMYLFARQFGFKIGRDIFAYMTKHGQIKNKHDLYAALVSKIPRLEKEATTILKLGNLFFKKFRNEIIWIYSNQWRRSIQPI